MLSAKITRPDHRGKIIRLVSGGIVVPVSGMYCFKKYECVVVKAPPRMTEVYKPGDTVTMECIDLERGEEIQL